MTRLLPVFLALLLPTPVHAGGAELVSGPYVATTPVEEAAERQVRGAGMVLADAGSGDIWAFQHLPPSALPMGPHDDVDALVKAVFPLEQVETPTDLDVGGATGRSVTGTAQGLTWRVCYRWIDDGLALLSWAAETPGPATDFVAACAGIEASHDRWPGPRAEGIGVSFDEGHTVRWSTEQRHEQNVLLASFLIPSAALRGTVTLALHPEVPMIEEEQRSQLLVDGAKDVRRLVGAGVTGFQFTVPENDGSLRIEAHVVAPGRLWMVQVRNLGPTQGQVVADWLEGALTSATFVVPKPSFDPARTR